MHILACIEQAGCGLAGWGCKRPAAGQPRSTPRRLQAGVTQAGTGCSAYAVECCFRPATGDSGAAEGPLPRQQPRTAPTPRPQHRSPADAPATITATKKTVLSRILPWGRRGGVGGGGGGREGSAAVAGPATVGGRPAGRPACTQSSCKKDILLQARGLGLPGLGGPGGQGSSSSSPVFADEGGLGAV